MQTLPGPSIETIRAQFPTLASDFAFLENAGGSQVPSCVPEAIKEYMLTSYVQLGAPYPISQAATETVARAHAFAETFVNAGKVGKCVIGPSTTQLVSMLAECYERALSPGDEIIIAETAHEANAGPWEKLQAKGFTIRVWNVSPDTFECSLEDLEKLLNNRTKIVAFPHVSNLLGGIVDIASITDLAHRYGARVVADGVAYAPHRAIDVQAWDVDYYVYSIYKVYGPHMAVLYGKHDALTELTGPNHFFLPKNDVYKFELGGASHEACAGLLATGQFVQLLAGETGEFDHGTAQEAFKLATDLELPVQQGLMDYLLSKNGVKVIGPHASGASRVSTVSFTAPRRSSEIADEVCRRGIGVRSGHMYAYRLCKSLGIDTDDGVVRVSAVHYNTLDEIERLIDALEQAI